MSLYNSFHFSPENLAHSEQLSYLDDKSVFDKVRGYRALLQEIALSSDMEPLQKGVRDLPELLALATQQLQQVEEILRSMIETVRAQVSSLGKVTHADVSVSSQRYAHVIIRSK